MFFFSFVFLLEFYSTQCMRSVCNKCVKLVAVPCVWLCEYFQCWYIMMIHNNNLLQHYRSTSCSMFFTRLFRYIWQLLDENLRSEQNKRVCLPKISTDICSIPFTPPILHSNASFISRCFFVVYSSNFTLLIVSIVCKYVRNNNNTCVRLLIIIYQRKSRNFI